MNNIFNDTFELLTCVDLNNAGPDPVNLKPGEKSIYHFLYASQLYGTLFGVFGRFHIEDVDGGKTCNVSKVDLKILNYQGPVNIGFEKKPTYSKGDKTVTLSVQGANINEDQSVEFDNDLRIVKGSKQMIIFDRVVMPLQEMSDYIGRLPVNDGTRPVAAPTSRTPLFDSEFLDRSGAEHFKRPVKPGMFGYVQKEADQESNKKIFMPSLRCTQSNVNLYY
jgi:hypothetical protein